MEFLAFDFTVTQFLCQIFNEECIESPMIHFIEKLQTEFELDWIFNKTSSIRSKLLENLENVNFLVFEEMIVTKKTEQNCARSTNSRRAMHHCVY